MMRFRLCRRQPNIPYHPDYAAQSALWMAGDEELQAMIEEKAVTSKARSPIMGYLIAESDRRALRRANEAMVRATEQMARSSQVTMKLTWALVALTVALVGLTAAVILLQADAL